MKIAGAAFSDHGNVGGLRIFGAVAAHIYRNSAIQVYPSKVFKKAKI